MTVFYVAIAWFSAATAAMALLRVRHRGAALVSFGELRQVGTEQQLVLVTVYRAQQRLAFGVACVAVASGVLLGVVLIGRVAMSATLDVTLLASVVGVAGDIWLGTGAVRFYERVSKKFEEAVRASACDGKA